VSPTPSTEALAARLRGVLEHHAKYCGLRLLTDEEFEGMDQNNNYPVTSNSMTFGLVGERGRLWTVSVNDPDDGMDDP
jgi:hypothetical protein